MIDIGEVLRLHNDWLQDRPGGVKADLSRANLSRADLSGADGLPDSIIATRQIVPQYGAFFGYKKCRDGLVALIEIPAGAKRLGGLVGRKCRASKAKVIALYTAKGKKSRKVTAISRYDETFAYRVGKTVKPVEDFCDDAREECASGIHFYLTYEEAGAHL